MKTAKQLYDFMKSRCPEPCNRCCGVCTHLEEQAQKEASEEEKRKEWFNSKRNQWWLK